MIADKAQTETKKMLRAGLGSNQTVLSMSKSGAGSSCLLGRTARVTKYEVPMPENKPKRTPWKPGSFHKLIPAGEHGTAKIVHHTPDRFTRLRARFEGQPLDCQTYTRLFIGDTLWMTDAEFEWRTQLQAVKRMTGDVLIAGLGIGFILRPILQDGIASVTVLEKNADVIALVAPHFPTVKIIEADARSWIPPRRAFDAIYFDIWADIPNADDRDDIKALKRKYRPALRKGGWIGAWCEGYAR